MKIQVTYKKVGELVPYVGNSKLHPRAQIEELKGLITRFGFVVPILVDKNGTIIAGHGRLIAAIELGMGEVPVIVLAHLTDAQRRALTIADNKVQMNSSWDFEALASEISALADEDFDLTGLGFTDAELDNLLRDTDSVLKSYGPADHAGDGRPMPGVNVSADLEEVLPDDLPAMPLKAKFELVMDSANKSRLVERLEAIRTEYGFDGLEAAMVEMLDFWDKNS